MASANRVDRWARWSLLLALALAVLGKVLDRPGLAPFWGGLLFAFGEAALVGGLADWFAVKALFAHPFGIPFPHTAIIPRNRHRIVREVRELVQHEWLPRSLLTAKVEAFDFVGQGLLPVVEPLKPHLREVLRSAALDLLDQLSPQQVAGFLARGLAGSVDADKVGPFLADLARRAREEGWLAPLLREWVRALQDWAESPRSRQTIQRRLGQAAYAYQDRSWFKGLTLRVAEALGGVDLEAAAAALQAEVYHFATDQLAEESELQRVVSDGLSTVERRLRGEPEFMESVKGFILDTAQAGPLAGLLGPVLASLCAEGRRELASAESSALRVAMRQLDGWVARLEKDAVLREQLNAWCRRLAVGMVEKHHSLIGALVEEQMNRLSERNLSELIQAKVGEDLNWIRLNGTFVGGLVGTALYLSFTLGRWLLEGP
jgi:uncharacterized membrane-anchored protein YjiN (DUF445 family)